MRRSNPAAQQIFRRAQATLRPCKLETDILGSHDPSKITYAFVSANVEKLLLITKGKYKEPMIRMLMYAKCVVKFNYPIPS
jgi:hypothetical protein